MAAVTVIHTVHIVSIITVIAVISVNYTIDIVSVICMYPVIGAIAVVTVDIAWFPVTCIAGISSIVGIIAGGINSVIGVRS